MEPLSPRLIKSIFKYACSTALINNFKLNVFTFEDYCVAMEYIHITKDINTKKDNWHKNEEGYQKEINEAWKIICYVREKSIPDFGI